MLRYFLVAYNIVRRFLRRFFRNIGEWFLTLFQVIYERIKYRGKDFKWIW